MSMKKVVVIMLVILLTLSFYSCKKEQSSDITENSFSDGKLLYDIGAVSFEYVDECEILCECAESHGDMIVNDVKEFEFLCYYSYTTDYPKDNVQELLLFPNNFIVITVRGEKSKFRVMEDGSLVGTGSDTLCKVYQADEEHRLTPEMFSKIHSKYNQMK